MSLWIKLAVAVASSSSMVHSMVPNMQPGQAHKFLVLVPTHSQDAPISDVVIGNRSQHKAV